MLTALQDTTQPRNAPELPPAVRDHLGEQLRLAYGVPDVPGAPDRILTALARLDAILAEMGEALTREMRDGLAQAAPSLRAFALSLTRNESKADDLVQDTMLKAWKSRDRFEPGTNLSAWLFTIMRNMFYSDFRKARREVEDADGSYSSRLTSAPVQGERLDVQDMQAALQKLPAEQREALMLVAVSDVSYEEAAAVMGCKVGTVKSRVSRARDRLYDLLGYATGDLGIDRVTLSVMDNATA